MDTNPFAKNSCYIQKADVKKKKKADVKFFHSFIKYLSTYYVHSILTRICGSLTGESDIDLAAMELRKIMHMYNVNTGTCDVRSGAIEFSGGVITSRGKEIGQSYMEKDILSED